MKIDVTTNRYGNARVGANTRETVLSTSNVAVGRFGKVFSRTVDGDLYAQPLIVTGITIGGRQRDVVVLATSRNWVYAYDADAPDEVLPLWSRNLGRPVPRDAIFRGYLNFAGEVGITSTPAIDLDGKGGGTLYVVVKTLAPDEGPNACSYAIHALDLLTGDMANSLPRPVRVTGRVRAGRIKRIEFGARLQLNRPGVLLDRGVLYLAFGSHGDEDPFYGWIMAYEASTLKQLAVYNTAPDWGQGGIWQSGTGLAADADGFVYAVVGNGEAPSVNKGKTPPVPEPKTILRPVYGNAILKLQLIRGKRRTALKVVDWFTASDVMALNQQDTDFVGGPVVFDVAAAGGASGQMVLGGGKDGRFYLADRKNLGRWMPDKNTRILQSDQLCAYHIHGAPVIWQKSDTETVAFVWSEKDFLRCFALRGSRFDPKPLSTGVYGFPQDELRMPGGILTLSSDGMVDGSGIVWASHPTDDDGMNKTVRGTLRAYDARDLNNELWNSDMDAEGADRVGSFAKFCPPVVANGKVYLSTFSRELAVYGLLAEAGIAERDDEVGLFQLRGIGPGVQASGSYTCSRYDLRITGQGIGGKQDSFLLASVNRDADHEDVIAVTARVEGINAAQYPNAQAGVMVRKFSQDPAPESRRFAALLITNRNKAIFLHRDEEGVVARQDGPIDVTLPCFVRIAATRVAGLRGVVDIEGQISQDGVTWSTVSALTRITMDGRLMAGLAVTAAVGAAPDTSAFQAHASFTKVAIVPALSDVTVG